MTPLSVAIISGAAQGLGRAFAETFSQQGYQVLALDIREEVNNIPGVHGMLADISIRADVERVAAEAANLGDVRVLVNNAAQWRATPITSNWAQTLEDWAYIMDTNLKGTLMLSRALVPLMQAANKDGGGGYIFNLSTDYVLPPKREGTNSAHTDLYNASKWALNGFTDAWSKYLAKDNIKVNGLCIGAVDTPMLRGAFPDGLIPSDFEALQTSDITQLSMDIIASGRSGENFGAWPGEPVTIGVQPPPHKRITG